MNTVRNASGRRSIRASISARTCDRIARRSGSRSGSSPSIDSCVGRSIDSMTDSRGMTCALRRRSRPSASLITMRTSQVESFESARKVDSAPHARRYASCSASSASASVFRMLRAVRNSSRLFLRMMRSKANSSPLAARSTSSASVAEAGNDACFKACGGCLCSLHIHSLVVRCSQESLRSRFIRPSGLRSPDPGQSARSRSRRLSPYPRGLHTTRVPFTE